MIGYNVYRAREGCGGEFFGFAETLDDARRMIDGPALAEHLYATARAAGHVCGITAPDTRGEAEDKAVWLTGDCVAVPVDRRWQ